MIKKVIFFSVFFTVFLFISPLVYSQGWFNPNWNFRKSVDITENSGSDLTNYPVEIIVTYDSDMNSDFSDLRFTDSDETSLVPHWIESYTPSTSATVWVNIPNIPASSTKTIYMYYGNPSATTTSDGDDVFEFFDDFDSFDASRWTATGGYSVSSSQLTITTGSVYTDNIVAFQPGFISEAKVKWNNFATYSGLEIANESSTSGSNSDSDKLVYLMTNSGGSSNVVAWAADGTTASYNIASGATQFTSIAGTTYIIGHAVNSSHVIFYKDRAISNSYSGTWSDSFYLWLGYFTGSGAGTEDIADIVVDWIIVRKYVNPKPTHGSWGEESVPPPEPILIRSLYFSTTLDQINLNWITEYSGDTVNVECKLVIEGGEQNCVPPTYSGPPGGGGCTILTPVYDMTPDSGGELRTKPNTIYCNASDPNSPGIYVEATRIFYPISFEVFMPTSMSLTVGEEQDLVIIVKNNGTLSDVYGITVDSNDPGLLTIENGAQTTASLSTNDVQQIYVGVNALTSEQTTTADIVISSDTSKSYTEIKSDQTLTVKGGLINLPDFGFFGIIQIMLIAAVVLVSFLF